MLGAGRVRRRHRSRQGPRHPPHQAATQDRPAEGTGGTGLPEDTREPVTLVPALGRAVLAGGSGQISSGRACVHLRRYVPGTAGTRWPGRWSPDVSRAVRNGAATAVPAATKSLRQRHRGTLRGSQYLTAYSGGCRTPASCGRGRTRGVLTTRPAVLNELASLALSGGSARCRRRCLSIGEGRKHLGAGLGL